MKPADSTSKGCAAPTRFKSWNSIDWDTAQKQVRSLQLRIAKATREGKKGKVKALQWIRSHSMAAKALAVKRVTQNKGASPRIHYFEYFYRVVITLPFRSLSRLSRKVQVRFIGDKGGVTRLRYPTKTVQNNSMK